MTKKRKHHQSTRQRCGAERKAEQQTAGHSRHCPGCDGSGYAVVVGRREPEAWLCPICRGAPHVADAPHAHLGTLEGDRWHESNWRCERCDGSGEITECYTELPYEQAHGERCPDCGGLGVRVMEGEGLQLYVQHDREQLTSAIDAAIGELEAVQKHDGHAPSTEKVLRQLYRALGRRQGVPQPRS